MVCKILVVKWSFGPLPWCPQEPSSCVAEAPLQHNLCFIERTYQNHGFQAAYSSAKTGLEGFMILHISHGVEGLCDNSSSSTCVDGRWLCGQHLSYAQYAISAGPLVLAIQRDSKDFSNRALWYWGAPGRALEEVPLLSFERC